MAQVLVVDDERSMREFLQIMLEGDGHDVLTAGDVLAAIAQAEKHEPDLVFTDLKLGQGDGMEVLGWVREHLPDTQVIMMTAFATAENAVEAMRQGAYDYQIKPIKVEEIRALVEKALEKLSLIRSNRDLSAQLRGRFGLSRFVTSSACMHEVIALIEKVAPTRTNVLVEGESGTGKELVARAIHEGSPRANNPFVAINCGAIPENLIEAELFGHAAGSFTGATKARGGLFEAANTGTVLLDEIGELPSPMQVKLLRVIQERKVRRVGEDKERDVDVRIVAATNKDLQALSEQNLFREDLFYRLNVVRIRVPPLRDRKEDIPLLAKAFVSKYSSESNKTIEKISDEAYAALTRFDFPGNVRELENYMERAVALASGDQIELTDLPEEVSSIDESSPSALPYMPSTGLDLEENPKKLLRSTC